MDSEVRTALRILSKAFLHLSTHWTNRGFKIRDESGSIKVCAFGALDVASREILGRAAMDKDFATIVLNEVAYSDFGSSLVTVNDELGYRAVTRLFALSIERLVSHATRTNILTRPTLDPAA